MGEIRRQESENKREFQPFENVWVGENEPGWQVLSYDGDDVIVRKMVKGKIFERKISEAELKAVRDKMQEKIRKISGI